MTFFFWIWASKIDSERLSFKVPSFLEFCSTFMFSFPDLLDPALFCHIF